MSSAAELGISEQEYRDALNLEKLYNLVGQAKDRCSNCGGSPITHVDCYNYNFVCRNCAAKLPNCKRLGDERIKKSDLDQLDRRYRKFGSTHREAPPLRRSKSDRSSRPRSSRRRSPSSSSFQSTESDRSPKHKSRSKGGRSPRKRDDEDPFDDFAPFTPAPPPQVMPGAMAGMAGMQTAYGRPWMGQTGMHPGMGQGVAGMGGMQSGMGGMQTGMAGMQTGMGGMQTGMGGMQSGMGPGMGGLQSRMSGMHIGTAQGMAGMHPGMSGMHPGMSGMQPGMSGMQPGMSGMQPGMSGMQPGMSGMQPGMSSMQPGMSGMHIGMSGMQPGMGQGVGSLQPNYSTQPFAGFGFSRPAGGFGPMSSPRFAPQRPAGFNPFSRPQMYRPDSFAAGSVFPSTAGPFGGMQTDNQLAFNFAPSPMFRPRPNPFDRSAVWRSQVPNAQYQNSPFPSSHFPQQSQLQPSFNTSQKGWWE